MTPYLSAAVEGDVDAAVVRRLAADLGVNIGTIRVAVRAVEAWLLGDRARIASFLRVRQRDVPPAPEQIANPKRTLVDVARASSSRDLRADVVPRIGSGRIVGPAYSSRMIEFVTSSTGWRPDAAAERCDSLRRAREALLMFKR